MVHSNFSDQPPLSQAVFLNDLNKVRTCILNRENVNCEDSDGRSPLHAASYAANAEIADFLLLSGARADKKDGKWQTPLHYACAWRRSNVVEILLNHNADVTQRDRHWQTVLHICAANNALQCAELLLPLSGKIVNIGDRKGRTPLHVAAFCGFIEMVDLLLRHEGDFNARDKSERRPVHLAAFAGRADVVKQLAEAGAELGAKDKNLFTALHCASAGGHDGLCSYLLQRSTNKDAYVNWPDKEGNTCLHVAANNGRMEVAAVLLDNGANVNAKNSAGMTALHLAAASTDGSACVDLLIERKADVNVPAANGRTPLHMLASYCRLKQAQRLLDNRANVNCRDKEGDTALHIASRYGHDLLIKKLISVGANVNACNSHGITPLHLACHRGYLEPVKTLIENRADIFALDNYGRNCLHYAAFSTYNATKCIDYLLENGASVASADEFWRIPLHYACMADSPDHVERLLEAGSDKNAHDSQGRQPLHYAAALEGSEKCAFLLLQQDASWICFDKRGWTALHYASYRGHLPLAQYLVSSSTCKEEINNVLRRLPCTPLHLAAANGHEDLLDMLLSRIEKADPRDRYGFTPLHWATYEGHTRCVEKLLNSSANCLAVDKLLKTTPIHLAAGYRQTPALRVMISQYLCDPSMANAFDCHKRTPVMMSVSNGAAESVLFLLSLDPDITVQDTKGRSALHRSACQGSEKIVQMLLHQLRICHKVEQGLFARDDRGRTPFHYAAQSGHSNVLAALIREVPCPDVFKVTTVDLYDTWGGGQTPLHWACYQGALEYVELLLDGPLKDHLLEERGGITALHCAVAIGSEACCELLLERGSRNVIENTDEKGRTPLHVACSRGFAECVRVLLEAGAFVNAVDQARMTPLMHAAAKGHCQIIEKLMAADADCLAVDVEKWTALHHACLKGQEEAAGLLIAACANPHVLNRQGHDGRTAMHIAARSGLMTAVEKLLLAGASVSIMDDNDQTAAGSCAVDQNAADCLALIICGMFPDCGPLSRLSTGSASSRLSICGQSIIDSKFQSRSTIDSNNTIGGGAGGGCSTKENASASGQSSDSEFF